MATSWLQRAARHASRYFEEAFSEPGVLKTFQEELFQFKSPSSIGAWQVLTDAHLGGLTTAEVEHSEADGGHLIFHGNYNHDIPPETPSRVHKLGQASVVSKVYDDHHIYLGTPERQVAADLRFRLRGDGRIYLAYLKTDSYAQGAGVYDIWQTPLHPQSDDWEEVVVPLDNFMLTSGGHVTEEQPHINPTRVVAIGFALAGGRELQDNGPFRLCLGGIWAGYSDKHSSHEE